MSDGSKVFWKYPFAVQEILHIKMPLNAQILHLDVQRDIPAIWALVDSDLELETRKFYLYGTGHRVPDRPQKYVGSFLMYDGQIVFHLFEALDA